MTRRISLAVFACLAASCDVAPIATPESGDVAESFALVSDWPRLPAGRTLGRVLGVAVAPDGRVWISHTADGGARNTRPIGGKTIAVLDPDTGEVEDELGEGLFQLPHALAFDDEGLLWVTDADANRVIVLDPRSRAVVRRIGAE